MTHRIHQSASRQPRLTRRAALIGTGATAIAWAAARAQNATPSASPSASPAASPVASPIATPATPVATPEPVYPLAIVREQRPEWVGEPVDGGELRLFVKQADVNSFVPTRFSQDPQIALSYLDPLVWVDGVTLEPKPWLATTWTWAADGLSLSFDLRKDVTWHDGSAFSAADVAFSWQCYRDDYDSAVNFMFAVAATFDVESDHRITVRFDEPDGTFPFNAANLPIFSKAQYEATWTANAEGERTLGGFDPGKSRPLGTGPWKITSHSDLGVSLERNGDHFAAVPHFEKLALAVSDGSPSQVPAWKKDHVGLTWPVAGTDIEGLLQEDGTLVVADATVSFFAAYNFGNPNRADPGWMATAGLREALTRAIDRAKYAESAFGGYIDVERAGFMTQPWAIDGSVKNPKHDPKAAAKLLADNGFADIDGDGILEGPSGDKGIFTTIVRDDLDPAMRASLDSIAGDLKAIGFDLDIQELSAKDFTTRWTTTFDYDLIVISLSQYAALNEFDLVGADWSIRRNTNGWNPGGYFNAEVNDAINAYFGAWKPADMKAPLQAIQRATNDDPFALWLGFPKELVLLRPDMAGFVPNKLWQSMETWAMWRQQGASVATPIPPTPVPATPPPASPVASPAASPAASPFASPESRPASTPRAAEQPRGKRG